MKKFLAAVPALVLVFAALTGCAAGGSSLDLTFSGDIGGTVKFESGYPIKNIGDKIELVEHGDKKADGAEALLVKLTAFNGTDGSSFGAQGATIPTKVDAQTSEWVKKIVESTGFDQRAVVAGSVESLMGAEAAAQFGMKATDPIVFVADVMPKPLTKAEGAEQTLPSGFPMVKLAKDGAPTLTLPSSPPPSDLQIANTIVGDGETVQDGDYVYVQYQGTNWNTGKVFDSSWERGAPTGFPTNGVIPGFTKALVGQKVGSQVVAIIPPAEGYGEAGSPPNIGGTDTIVFVVDILATVHTK